MSGRVIHFEIPADDLQRAQAFYRAAFGWTINPVPQMDYAIVSTTPSDDNGAPADPGAINGGMLARQGQITSPIITIEVDDIEQALRRIEDLGAATAIGRQAVGKMGFAAYFTDPEGNVVGLWQPARG